MSKNENEAKIAIAGSVKTKPFANVKTKKYEGTELQVLQCLDDSKMVFAIPVEDAMKLIDKPLVQKSICKSFKNID